MKVLLTGPFGKIGYRVLEALLAKGHTVTCFDLDSPANRKTARDFSGPALAGQVRVIWGDITNASQVAAAVAEEGDTVLLAPAAASMDQFADYADRGRRFNEAVRARLGGEADGDSAPHGPTPEG